jgi:osmotically-inducible protein OsmY
MWNRLSRNRAPLAAFKQVCFAAFFFVAIAQLAACSTVDAYRKCADARCPDDARINAAVKAEIFTHPALRPPDDIGVQTIDGVVYLSGLVDTDQEKDIAEAAARGVAGVSRVVNSIGVRSQVH